MAKRSLELLLKVNGIGQSTMEKFRTAGFHHLDDLRGISAEHLIERIDGVGESTAYKIIHLLEEENLRETDKIRFHQVRFQELMEQLFRYDQSTHDFGIYRVINQNREEISAFIYKTIPDIFEQEIQKLVKHREEDATESQDEETVILHTSIYNHLYLFFKRYYSEGDFIPRMRIARDTKYAIPYNGQESYFYWVNQDQYYIKNTDTLSDISFRSNSTTIRFQFLDSDKQGSDSDRYVIIRPSLIKVDREELVIPCEYRGLTTEEIEEYELESIRKKQRELNTIMERNILGIIDRQDMDHLLAELKQEKSGTTLLRSYIDEFTTTKREDYFIHKNLGTFLHKELDYYLKTEVVNLDRIGQDRQKITTQASMIQLIRAVASTIIDFLDQIESFQKKLWEKKKFVIQTDYCITLDQIPREMYSRILSQEKQLRSWKELYGQEITTISDLESHPFMMVDTLYFDQSFKYEILASIENLDSRINGTIIKSDNYQALNLIKAKYRETVRCIYIDPPYNTGSDDFVYKDNFKHSSWLSMMNDRLLLARHLLSRNGAIYISCDDNEESELKLLCDEIFGRPNFLAKLIWEKVHTRKNSAKYFSSSHDYILVYARDKDNWDRELLPREDTSNYSNPDNDPKGPWKRDPIIANNPYDSDYTITKPNGVELKPPEGQFWRYSEESFQRKVDQDEVLWNDGDSYPYVKRYLHQTQDGLVPVTLFDREFAGDNAQANSELSNILGTKRLVSYPKPSRLIQRVLQINSGPDDTILDFFAGSGTTAHAVIRQNREDKGNRKYLLIEQGEYFEDAIKTRIQRLVYSPEWNNGSPESQEGDSHVLKYHYLEQYQDTLENVSFNKSNHTFLDDDLGFQTRHSLEYQSRDNRIFLNIDALQDPQQYSMQIRREMEAVPTQIDLVETFNYLMGIWVRHEYQVWDNQRAYHVIEGTVSSQEVMVIWRSMHDLDFTRDAEFISNELVVDQQQIYINGDSAVKNAQSLDKLFKQKLGVMQ